MHSSDADSCSNRRGPARVTCACGLCGKLHGSSRRETCCKLTESASLSLSHHFRLGFVYLISDKQQNLYYRPWTGS